jgi:hypothetical protein
MACKYIYKGTTYTKEEFESFVKEEFIKKSPENKFLSLLEKDNNWVTFFIKSIIQDSAKKGYEKVLFPTGNTASKVEGHQTLEEFKKQKEDRINKLNKEIIELKGLKLVEKYEKVEKRIEHGKYSLFNGYEKKLQGYEFKDNEGFTPAVKYGKINKLFTTKEDAQNTLNYIIENIEEKINQLKQELEIVEREGFGALKPIYNFYENTVTNILKKTYGKENVKLITDEYGNEWREITIDENRDNQNILFQKIPLQKVVKSPSTVRTDTELIPHLENINKMLKKMDYPAYTLEEFRILDKKLQDKIIKCYG